MWAKSTNLLINFDNILYITAEQGLKDNHKICFYRKPGDPFYSLYFDTEEERDMVFEHIIKKLTRKEKVFEIKRMKND